MKKVYSILGCLILFFSLFSHLHSGQKTETFERNLSIDSSKPVLLEFYDVDGNLNFTSWGENSVQIRVEKKIKLREAPKAERLLRETEVKVTQKGNSIRIEIKYPNVDGIFFLLRDYQRVKVSTEIRLPANSNLTCTLSDGSIQGEKVKGQMDMKTDDGSIRLNDIQGSIKAKSEDGRIILKNIQGDVEARSEDGDIFLSGQIKKLNLSSSDGDIEAKLAPQSFLEEDWKISSEDGNIDFFLPSDFSANFTLRTDDGDIDCQFPVVFTDSSSRRKLSGKFNKGGFLLNITTEDGHITLRKTSD